MVSPSRSGRWEECPLVSEPLDLFFPRELTVPASSAVIEEIGTMQESGLACLAMYYYDFREAKKKDIRGLLSSVLFQLCNQSDSYHRIISTFYSTHLNGAQSPSDDE